MLGLCRAIIIAPTPFDSHALADIAAEVGFGDIASIFDDGESNGLKYPVSFFLVHHRLSDTDCDDIIDAVRHIDRKGLRYSPMVVLMPETSSESVRKFVRMGFDDVISLPQSRVQLTARLGTQLDRDIVYFETGDYLGPDRRRMDADSALQRRTGVSPHTRLVIHRDADYGTRIVSRQLRSQQHFHAAPPDARPLAPIGLVAAARTRVFGKRQSPPEMEVLPALSKSV
jgi:DNA-binding response OmpR family regulator